MPGLRVVFPVELPADVLERLRSEGVVPSPRIVTEVVSAFAPPPDAVLLRVDERGFGVFVESRHVRTGTHLEVEP